MCKNRKELVSREICASDPNIRGSATNVSLFFG
jgi:hypothetical protein